MELGARIKAARLAAGLSQRQLCGDTITRNMLSLIESGRAKPSMDTLAHLAARLEKPMGYFLEEQAVTSPNQTIMDSARNAYTAGDYREALAALENYRAPDAVFDPERYLLGALAAMGLAQQASAGKPAYALRLLEQAEQWGRQSVYWTEDLERRRLLLIFRADTSQAAGLVKALPQNTEELLLRGRAALEEGDAVRCAQILDAAGVREADWYLLRGQAAMEQEDYRAAAGYLHRAEEALPGACYPMLERCYRELEDFKLAYEYACKQRTGN